MDGGAWWAAVQGVAKSQTRLSDFTFTFHFHAQEKEMATHSSGSDGEESACSAGDLGLIPGLRRSPGEVNGNPLQYSYLENSMDRGVWQATVCEAAKSQIQLSENTFTFNM